MRTPQREDETPQLEARLLIFSLKTSSKPFKVKPQPDPGYVYLYSEEGMCHRALILGCLSAVGDADSGSVANLIFP